MAEADSGPSSSASRMTVQEGKEQRKVREWLNTRPDLLLAISKRYTSNSLLQPAQKASLTLEVYVPSNSPTKEILKICISTRARSVELDIPLSPRPRPSGSSSRPTGEIRKVIEGMGEDAFKYFGIPSNPQVKTFLLPKAKFTFGPIIGLSALLFLLLSSKDNDLGNQGRALVHKYIGNWIIPAATYFAASTHFVIEPIICLRNLIRYKVPFIPSFLYILTVVIIGYGGIEALNRAVIQERFQLLHPKSSSSSSIAESKKFL